jgi:putative endopeptidase
LTNLDTTVSPADDFYQYATGGWQEKNPLKPEFARYGSFDVLRENNEKRINELFSAMAKTKAESGSVEQKISDLYKMGLDSVRLNEEGVSVLAKDFATIDAITDGASLAKVVAEMHLKMGNPLFGMYVTSDLMNSSINTLYISQSGLGMGNRDYYVDQKNADKKAAYVTYLEKIFTLAGVEGDVKKMVESVVAIEDRIADKHWSNVECRDIQKGYNPFSYDEFKAKFNGVNWDAYFAAMGLGTIDKLVVSQPSSFLNILDVINTADVEALRAYVVAHYIDAAASYLSEEFAVASLDALVRAKANIIAVITAPDKPAGRGMKLTESAVKKYAVEKSDIIIEKVGKSLAIFSKKEKNKKRK